MRCHCPSAATRGWLEVTDTLVGRGLPDKLRLLTVGTKYGHGAVQEIAGKLYRRWLTLEVAERKIALRSAKRLANAGGTPVQLRKCGKGVIATALRQAFDESDLIPTTLPFRLFGLLRPLALAQAHAGAAAVFVDEFDAGVF